MLITICAILGQTMTTSFTKTLFTKSKKEETKEGVNGKEMEPKKEKEWLVEIDISITQ